MKQMTGSIVEYQHGETLAYDTTFAQLRRVVDFSDATVATTLPRAGLQVIQPRETDLSRLRLYGRECHAFDAVAWRAMDERRAIRLSDLLADRRWQPVTEQFREMFLRPFGFEHYCCVPLRGPVLRGYPGVLQLFRTSDAGDFADSDLPRLESVGDEFDAVFDAEHSRGRFKQDQYPLAHVPRHRQFAVLRRRRIAFPANAADMVGDALLQNLLETAEERLAAADEGKLPPGELSNGELIGDTTSTTGDAVKPAAAGSNADRVLVPDRFGDYWPFRLALFPRYPAISGDFVEPVAVVSHQPACESWSALRPSDFAADEEVARLIPALHFMQENFTSNVSLHEIARIVHLSPFHFHRRFTDLLGITPKHYLFDCQIAEAKRKLAGQEMDLRQIASHCGFAHQSHFTSRFKQATGLTPTHWRRLAQEQAHQSAGGRRTSERAVGTGR